MNLGGTGIQKSGTGGGGGLVTSVFARIGDVVAVSGDYNTSLVTELTNLYFTDARVLDTLLTGYVSGAGVVAATDSVLEAIQKLNGNADVLVTGVSSVFGRVGAVVAVSGDYNTSLVTELTNLYFTEARVYLAPIVAVTPAAGTVSP